MLVVQDFTGKVLRLLFTEIGNGHDVASRWCPFDIDKDIGSFTFCDVTNEADDGHGKSESSDSERDDGNNIHDALKFGLTWQK